MKKYLFILSLFFSVQSFSQTTKEKIEKAMNDPKVEENAARADALLIDKKNIKDSTAYNERIDTTFKKERNCVFKRKKKSAKKTS